jgi:hypothetical protein
MRVFENTTPVRVRLKARKVAKKTGRNDLCPCGSGSKYKKCCLSRNPRPFIAPDVNARAMQMLERHRAEERLREAQQGYGRPITAFQRDGVQFVTVANKVFHSQQWKTFTDFLPAYLKAVLTPEWGNAEIAKLLQDRHQILRWYDAYCQYQKESIKEPGVVQSAKITGVVACFMGLAYSLYLLDHNVELQERLVRRLKDPSNFQGAYYELIVANVLIRAGFTLVLEDETDGKNRHCEFAAISKHTGQRYWVEAKMRAVSGLLGKTDNDGTRDRNPLSSFRAHLNDALDKPAQDARLIFIDVNSGQPMAEDGLPKWRRQAASWLENHERKHLKPGVEAYVFVTNIPFHRSLSGSPSIHALSFGLGMPDFNRPATLRLFDYYKRRKKHFDAHKIEEAILRYLDFPTTFDGTLPSDTFGEASPHLKIGDIYLFPDGEGTVVGTVTTATVNIENKYALFGVNIEDGSSRLVRQEMTDDQISDYKRFPDVYFGRVQPAPKIVKTRVHLFESLLEQNQEMPRDVLLRFFAGHHKIEDFRNMTIEDLRALYCEEMVARAVASGFKVD